MPPLQCSHLTVRVAALTFPVSHLTLFRRVSHLVLAGEDALVNVSVEKQSDGRLGGYIRIRSKTQGIALSLGDKITLRQKVASPSASSSLA
jgi:hypothetical protein